MSVDKIINGLCHLSHDVMLYDGQHEMAVGTDDAIRAVREAVEAERERHPRMKRIPADHIEWNEWDGFFLSDMVTRPDWAHREAWLLSDMEGYWIEKPTVDDDE